MRNGNQRRFLRSVEKLAELSLDRLEAIAQKSLGSDYLPLQSMMRRTGIDQSAAHKRLVLQTAIARTPENRWR